MKICEVLDDPLLCMKLLSSIKIIRSYIITIIINILLLDFLLTNQQNGNSNQFYRRLQCQNSIVKGRTFTQSVSTIPVHASTAASRTCLFYTYSYFSNIPVKAVYYLVFLSNTKKAGLNLLAVI